MFENIPSSIPSKQPNPKENKPDQQAPGTMFQTLKKDAPTAKKPSNVIVDAIAQSEKDNQGAEVMNIDTHETKINRRNILLVVGTLLGTLIILTIIGFIVVKNLSDNSDSTQQAVVNSAAALKNQNTQTSNTNTLTNAVKNTNISNINSTPVVAGPCTYTDANEPVLNPSLDTDNDGLLDGVEHAYKTSIYIADTDGDTYLDGKEVDGGYNPCGSGSLK